MRFDLLDRPVAIEGQVADRREVVEVGVARQAVLHLVASPLEFLVLQLQLDLVHLQLVDQPLRFERRHLVAGGGSGRRAPSFFSARRRSPSVRPCRQASLS